MTTTPVPPNKHTTTAPAHAAAPAAPARDAPAQVSPARDVPAAPERPAPEHFDKDHPLAPPGSKDYVAGQPVDDEEAARTNAEVDARMHPKAREGTRPDGRPLRDPNIADDDVNKRPGGVGGQGTRADGRTRAPDLP